jgi:chromosome segregation ATPase
MSSSDSPGGTAGSEPRLVRTTGLQPAREGRSGQDGASDDATAAGEVRRLRDRVAELEGELDRRDAALADREARIEELTAELETARHERDDANEWATFLDRELREHRAHVETLEDRIEALESGPSGPSGLLGRLRGLFG